MEEREPSGRREQGVGPVIISFGEALWDLLPEGRRLGGAPLNFAYRCAELGCTSYMISAIGDDALGREARQLIQSLGLNDRYIRSLPGVPTGTVEVSFDELKNPDYTIIPGVAYDRVPAADDLLELAAEADALCFGTLAQRAETSRRTLESLLDAFRGRFTVLDLNLRKDCYTERIILRSVERADILKLNEEEAVYLAGLYGVHVDAEEPTTGAGAESGTVQRLAADLRQAGGLDYCVITLGPRGAAAAWREGTEHVPGHAVELADPLGAGDAFTAAFLTALLQKRSPAEAVRLGNRLGALVAGQAGAAEPIPADKLFP